MSFSLLRHQTKDHRSQYEFFQLHQHALGHALNKLLCLLSKPEEITA